MGMTREWFIFFGEGYFVTARLSIEQPSTIQIIKVLSQKRSVYIDIQVEDDIHRIYPSAKSFYG